MQSQSLPKLFLITNARIIDPVGQRDFRGEILLKNGRIETVQEKIDAAGAEELDVQGKVVTHGFCDIHSHFREPGREDKETLASGSQAALAGGFTTVCVMPNTDPPLDTPESIRFIIEKANALPVSIHPIGAITVNQEGKELAEMGAMAREGAVAFSDDGIPLMDSGVMRRALEYASLLDVPIMNHAEDLTLKGDGQMNEGEWSTKLGLAGVPDVSESSMVSRDIQICEFTRGKLHVLHVSSQKSLDAIRRAKKHQLNVTAEVTPHHLYFSDAALSSYDTNLKVAPPLRTEKDRQSLVEALKDNIIDCIATDHAPHSVEEKEAPFDWAAWGMIGLESALGAVWKILAPSSFSLMEVVEKLTVNPRRVMGFDQDLLKKGKQAELVIFDPDSEWVFCKEHIYSKSRNSPFLGETLKGRILNVISKRRLFTLTGLRRSDGQSRET